MRLRTVVFAMAFLFSAPAFAECTGNVCGAVQKLLEARSSNFAKFKGKPGIDPRGDTLWEGTYTIPGLMDYCYVYSRGESSHYEYHCEAAALGTQPSLPLERAKQIAETLKVAFQETDPKLVWLLDPAAYFLAKVEGFEGTEGWYGASPRTKIDVRIKVVATGPDASMADMTVFAKPLAVPPEVR